jgi:hypothetical protein
MSKIEERFFNLFNGLTRAYGEFKLSGVLRDGVKVEGRASTVKGELTLAHWRDHLDGKTGLGIIPITDDGTVYWGAIDVDVYPVDFEGLQEKINNLKLPLLMCKSKSGGAHIYLFFNEAVNAALVRGKLMSIASALGYPRVEIYPKQVRLASTRDIGNWLNMPYFNAEKTQRYGMLDGKTAMGVKEFLTKAEDMRINADDLNAIKTGTEAFSDGPPCLQALAAASFPSGSRNNGLFAIAVYARNKFPDGWEKEVEDANQKYMQPPLSGREVLMVNRSAGKKTYAYNCSQNPINEYCVKDICKHRKYGIGGINEEDMLGKYNFGGITKIKTNPPLWIFEVNASRIELETDDIMNFLRFRKKFFETNDTLLPMVKQEIWNKLIEEKTQMMEHMDAPSDADPEGRLWYLLDAFCTGQSQGITKEDILMGRPYHDSDDHTVMFRSADFIRFLDQQHFRAVAGMHIWAALRRRGATYKQIKIKGKVTNVWIIPEFSHQVQAFDVPASTQDF